MSYQRNKNNNILESQLRQEDKIHKLEDFLRFKFMKNNISYIDIILIARILHGRILNSLYSTIDSRHSKSQLITLLCISFALSMRKNEMNFKINRDLFYLLQYHKRIIHNFLIETDIDRLNEKDKKYFNFCKEWYNCIDILINKKIISEDDKNILINLKIYLSTWLPLVDNRYYDLIMDDKHFINSLKKINISNFIK